MPNLESKGHPNIQWNSPQINKIFLTTLGVFIQALQPPCFGMKDFLKWFGTTEKYLSVKDAYLTLIKQRANYDYVGFIGY